MSEEHTRNVADSRSFEDRVFARFDSLDSRMQRMESQLENIARKMSVLGSDMVQLRADQAHAESRLDKLESNP